MLEHKRVSMIVDDVAEDGTIRGYGSVFGNVDLGGDIVAPGAFKRSIKARKSKPVPMLWNHNPEHPIGKWTILEEDERGLKLEGRMTPGVAKGAEVLAMVRDGVIDGLSIGFQTVKAERDETTGVRTLKEVDLWEVSLVTFPMNTEATVQGVKAMSIEEARDITERDWEDILTGKRDAVRLSRTTAQALMKGGIPAIRATRDAGKDAVHLVAAAIKSELVSMRKKS
jgi:HK97 family phage prohead protease